MKKLLIFAALFGGLAACTSDAGSENSDGAKDEKKEKDAQEKAEAKLDETYTNLVSDMCGCFNDATSELSDEGREVIESASESGEGLNMAMLAYAQRNPLGAVADGEVLASMASVEVLSCVADLEKKYSAVYLTDSKVAIQARMILMMKELDECKLTYTFMQAGFQNR